MNDCYCDFDGYVIAYNRAIRTARKEHKCYECGRKIEPGNGYENVSAIWERGEPWQTVKTCGNCVNLRDWVQAHVPCLCWSHGNSVEECLETARDYAHEAPGLLFGAWRRYRSPKFRNLPKEPKQ